jgi:hypothetical protein
LRLLGIGAFKVRELRPAVYVLCHAADGDHYMRAILSRGADYLLSYALDVTKYFEVEKL